MRKYFSGADLTPEELQKPELQIARALVEARQTKHVTQQQLAERTGIAQADISRLENGNSNPTLRTLQRLADGLEMTVKVGFKDNSPNADVDEDDEEIVDFEIMDDDDDLNDDDELDDMEDDDYIG